MERFREPDQSFAAYRSSNPVRPTARRRNIVLQPLGKFSKSERQLLDSLSAFASVFFDSKVRIEPTLALPSQGSRLRQSGDTSWYQYRTGVILEQLLEPHLPDDAICMLAVTMADLYPDDSWNFVFGEASLSARVGVYSLARFFPGFPARGPVGHHQQLVLRRSLHTLAHETGHMFSIAHCL
jgi:archaemetzincin